MAGRDGGQSAKPERPRRPIRGTAVDVSDDGRRRWSDGAEPPPAGGEGTNGSTKLVTGRVLVAARRSATEVLRDRRLVGADVARALFDFLGGYLVAARRRRSVPGVLIAAALFVASPFLLVLAVVALAALVVLDRLPVIGPRVRPFTLELTRSAGDAYLLLRQPAMLAAMVGRLRADVAWMSERCENVVIVAHSQGAALSHLLLRRGEELLDGPSKQRPLTLVTFGAAVWRLRAVWTLSQRQLFWRVLTPLLALVSGMLLCVPALRRGREVTERFTELVFNSEVPNPSHCWFNCWWWPPYLSPCNWPGRGGETIRSSDSSFTIFMFSLTRFSIFLIFATKLGGRAVGAAQQFIPRSHPALSSRRRDLASLSDHRPGAFSRPRTTPSRTSSCAPIKHCMRPKRKAGGDGKPAPSRYLASQRDRMGSRAGGLQCSQVEAQTALGRRGPTILELRKEAARNMQGSQSIAVPPF